MIGIRAIAGLALMAALPDCGGDETLTGYGAAGGEWQLQSIDGQAFKARATLRFPAEGQLEGDAPCNQYSGTQPAPYPWFGAEKLAVTRRACADLEAETFYLSTLGQMSLVEVAGDTMILSDDTGREMLFTRLP